jgi:uncharacterized protein YukE
MKMSIFEFGNSVEEIRQKLKEILPLVDAGQEVVQQLHNRMQGELSSMAETYDSFEVALNSVAEAGTHADEKVSAWESTFSSTVDEWSNKLNDFSELAKTSGRKFVDGKNLVEQTIVEMNESLTTVYGQSVTVLESMLSKLESASGQIQSFQDESNSKLEEVNDALSKLSDECTSVENSAKETLESLQNEISTAWSIQLEQMMKGMTEDTTAEAKSVLELIAKNSEVMVGFFGIFKSDSENVADEFGSKISELINGLKDSAEGQLKTSLQDGIENLTEKGVAAFATSVGQSLIMAQTGVATSSALSPVIPQIAVAQKLTDMINSIF